MKFRKAKQRKLLAFLIAFAIVISLLPTAALAVDAGAPPPGAVVKAAPAADIQPAAVEPAAAEAASVAAVLSQPLAEEESEQTEGPKYWFESITLRVVSDSKEYDGTPLTAVIEFSAIPEWIDSTEIYFDESRISITEPGSLDITIMKNWESAVWGYQALMGGKQVQYVEYIPGIPYFPVRIHQDGKLTITPRNVTVNVGDQTMTVGDELPDFTVSVDGSFVGNDEPAWTFRVDGDTSVPGTYDIVATNDVDAGKLGQCYDITVNAGKLTVNALDDPDPDPDPNGPDPNPNPVDPDPDPDPVDPDPDPDPVDPDPDPDPVDPDPDPDPVNPDPDPVGPGPGDYQPRTPAQDTVNDPADAPADTPIVPVVAPLAAAPAVIPAAAPVAAPAVIPAAAPAADAAAPVTPAADPVLTEETTQIDDAEVPLAAADALDTTEISDAEVPLAALQSGWALWNLILAIITVGIMAVLLIGYFAGKNRRNREERELLKRRGAARLVSVAVALVAVIVFILTENMNTPMIMTDQWTVWMAAIAIAQGIVAAFSAKHRKHDKPMQAQPMNS